jgi:hypothetical protein
MGADTGIYSFSRDVGGYWPPARGDVGSSRIPGAGSQIVPQVMRRPILVLPGARLGLPSAAAVARALLTYNRIPVRRPPSSDALHMRKVNPVTCLLRPAASAAVAVAG